MGRIPIRYLVLWLLIGTFILAGIVLASSDQDLSINWFRLGPGTRSSCAGEYSLVIAIGQPTTAKSQGDSYSLTSGILMEGPDCRYLSFPVILK